MSNSKSGIQGASLRWKWKSELSGQGLSELHGEDGNASKVAELSENLQVVAELPDNTLP